MQAKTVGTLQWGVPPVNGEARFKQEVITMWVPNYSKNYLMHEDQEWQPFTVLAEELHLGPTGLWVFCYFMLRANREDGSFVVHKTNVCDLADCSLLKFEKICKHLEKMELVVPTTPPKRGTFSGVVSTNRIGPPRFREPSFAQQAEGLLGDKTHHVVRP